MESRCPRTKVAVVIALSVGLFTIQILTSVAVFDDDLAGGDLYGGGHSFPICMCCFV